MNIDPNITKQIIDTIRSYKEPKKVILFGSRATNHSQATSDIDIAVMAEHWTDSDLNMIRHSVEENIKTPLKFDILLYHTIHKEKLKKNILEQGVILYDSRKN